MTGKQYSVQSGSGRSESMVFHLTKAGFWLTLNWCKKGLPE
jgi:hypothetical protein